MHRDIFKAHQYYIAYPYHIEHPLILHSALFISHRAVLISHIAVSILYSAIWRLRYVTNIIEGYCSSDVINKSYLWMCIHVCPKESAE